MRLEDFFNFKDLVRTCLVGSALFFFVGAFYGVFLHSQYAAQVTDVKNDLDAVGSLLEARANQAYENQTGVAARDFKDVSDRAKTLAKNVTAPTVSPNAYTYFNYWVASAAFTKLHLSPAILGLSPGTIDVLANLTNENVLGGLGWWNRAEFKGFNLASGQYEQFLEKPPELETNFWTFYIFVFVIAVMTTFFAVKEKYEIPIIPDIIYGAFMPVLFFVFFTLSGVLSLAGVVKFLDPSQVDLLVYLLSFVIMSVLSAFGALVAAMARQRLRKEL
jgi:hypothetical protein